MAVPIEFISNKIVWLGNNLHDKFEYKVRIKQIVKLDLVPTRRFQLTACKALSTLNLLLLGPTAAGLHDHL